MTTVHVTSTYNVEASINAYFKTALTAMSRPSFLPTLPYFAENTPEVKANFPAFSFVHLPAGSMDVYQGRNAEPNTKAMRNLGILDLSAWVIRSAVTWNAQLRFMQGMIETAYLDSRGGVIIRDYTTTPASPSASNYRATFNDLDIVIVSPDANPDVERRRCLIKYQWDARSTN
jgi:hypothetical protein